MYDQYGRPISAPLWDNESKRPYAYDPQGRPYYLPAPGGAPYRPIEQGAPYQPIAQGAPYAPVAGPPQYGQPGPQVYTGGEPPPPGPQARATLRPDTVADLMNKGDGEVYRAPFFPTAPMWKTSRDVGYISRVYTASLSYTDADYAVGTETARPIRFDIPARLIAFNGSAFPVGVEGFAFPVGVGPRGCWLFRAEYSNNERVQTFSGLAENVVGTAERPGEIGGAGWTIDMGGTFQVYFTPLLPGLRIDIALVCLEMRGAANFHRGI